MVSENMSIAQGNQVLRLLLKYGADPHADSIRLGLPIHHAIAFCRSSTIGVWLGLGYDINHIDKSGFSLIARAAEARGRCKEGATEIAKLLLQSGADPNAGTQYPLFLLFSTRIYPDQSLLSSVLGAGANPNWSNAQGTTPLHLAVAPSHFGLGCDPLTAPRVPAEFASRLPAEFQTKCQTAKLEDRVALVRSLVAKGADPTQRDTTGKSPLDLLAKYVNQEWRLAFEAALIKRPD